MVIVLKGLISPLSLVLGARNVKTTYRKSWPVNLLQVPNLTFDPCFKFKWGNRTFKRPYISIIICAMALKCERLENALKTAYRKSCPANI